MTEVFEVARKYKDRCDPSKIYCTSRWRDDILIDTVGRSKPMGGGEKRRVTRTDVGKDGEPSVSINDSKVETRRDRKIRVISA